MTVGTYVVNYILMFLGLGIVVVVLVHGLVFYIVKYIQGMRILYANGCSRHEAEKQWGQDLHVMLESPQGLVQSVGLEMAAARRPDHLSHTTFEMSIKTSKINTDTVKEERSRR